MEAILILEFQTSINSCSSQIGLGYAEVISPNLSNNTKKLCFTLCYISIEEIVEGHRDTE